MAHNSFETLPSLDTAVANRDRVAGKAQRGSARKLAEAQYHAERLKAIASGVPESALPPVTAGMDLKAANQALSFHTGGQGSGNLAATKGRQGPLDRTMQGVSNPPPTGVQGPQQVTQVRAPNPKAAINAPATGNESAKDYAAIQKKNADTYKPSDTVVTKAAAPGPLDRVTVSPGEVAELMHGKPGQAAVTPQGPTASGAPVAATPAVAATPGMTPQQIAEATGNAPAVNPATAVAGRNVVAETPFGKIASRQAGPLDLASTGKPMTAAAAPIMDGKVQVGVGRAAPQGFDSATARAALFQKHPKIFEAGTPENAAFVAHAKTYGEEDAHKGADSLMGSLALSQNTVRQGAEAARPESPTNPTDANTDAINTALHAPQPAAQPGLLDKIASVIAQHTTPGAGGAPATASTPATPTPPSGVPGTSFGQVGAGVATLAKKGWNALGEIGAQGPAGAPTPAPTAESASPTPMPNGAPATKTASGMEVPSNVPPPSASVTPNPRGPDPATNAGETTAGTNPPAEDDPLKKKKNYQPPVSAYFGASTGGGSR